MAVAQSARQRSADVQRQDRRRHEKLPDLTTSSLAIFCSFHFRGERGLPILATRGYRKVDEAVKGVVGCGAMSTNQPLKQARAQRLWRDVKVRATA